MALLDGDIAVVTGAASGIGRAIAEGFAREGATVIVADREGEAAREVADGIGQAAHALTLDVADREACDAFAERVRTEIGEVSVLVNNAGVMRRRAMTDPAADVRTDWDTVLSVNIGGVFNITHALLDQLRARRGRVVNIASIQSFLHMRTPNSAAYTTSKHAVLGFTRALAAELGRDGVRVNAIGPGVIATPLNAGVRENRPDIMQIFTDHTPLGRTGTPEDMVGPALFLASEMSAYVTGSIVMADGGYRTI